MKNKSTEYTVREACDLLSYLVSVIGTTRTNAKRWLQHRLVSVNGVVVSQFDTALKTGDKIDVRSGQGAVELRHPKLRLVYEDEHLIVVEKRNGLLSVPSTAGSSETTAYSILRAYVKKQNQRNGVFVVHRLDRETSGLLVFAKTVELQHYMREYWREIVTRRTYVAVAEGRWEKKQGQIRSWFTEDKRNAMVYSSPVDDGGDLAITNYEVLKETAAVSSAFAAKGGLSLVELHLETGRTNQIRVHLASAGHPVAGDRKYGHGNDPVLAQALQQKKNDRLCLHARVLEFIHPVTEQKLHFETPVPKSFLSMLSDM
ncbi:MAG: RluA family pseudouridine synthase [Paludibacteraceae bacterium]|nr:RluA family pseudouridine synthase [Paludibacteraceae bacterium]